MLFDHQAMPSEPSTLQRTFTTPGLHIAPLDVGGFFHLRSAGRGPELQALSALAQAVLGAPLAQVGAMTELVGLGGSTPGFAMRTRPSEIIVFFAATTDGVASPWPQVLASVKAQVSSSQLLHLVDASHGHAACSLSGFQARQLLLRVSDETSLPAQPGSATRLRLADVHLSLVWCADASYILVMDALLADFVHERLVYAAQGMDSPQPHETSP